jgi:HlyD family secretion protein
MSFFSRVGSFIRARWILSSLIVLIGGGGAFYALRSNSSIDTSLLVTRGSITETVSVTGQLVPSQSVDLSFQASGRVASVPAAVGASVQVGQVLASLDVAELNAQLRNAQASTAAQQAKLDGLLAGSRPEDIAVAQAQLDKAQQDFENTIGSVPDVLSSAYTKTNDGVRTQLLGLFMSNQSDAYPPQFITAFSCSSVSCTQSIQQIVSLRSSADVALDNWQKELDAFLGRTVMASAVESDQALESARGYIQVARDLLARLSSVVTATNISASSATLATYRASIDAGVTEIDAALNAITAQRQAIASQKIVVEQYASSLALKKAGSSKQDISAQRAAVLAAQAQVEQIQAQISKSVIRSPIAGVVTRQDAKIGQSASANVILISVISNQQLELEANVPEIDIGKVSVGNPILLTIDAFSGESFLASVSFIDPAETVLDGVVSFKIKSVLAGPSERLKSGLTANLEIQVRHKDNVLLLPQYGIIQNEDGSFVQKINGTTTVRVPVVLGLRSIDGIVEIVSGVAEGDRVENIGIKK